MCLVVICHSIYKKRKKKDRHGERRCSQNMFSLRIAYKIAICVMSAAFKQKTIFGVSCFGMFVFRNSIGILSLCLSYTFFLLWNWHTISVRFTYAERRMGIPLPIDRKEKSKVKKKWLCAERAEIK